MSELTCGDCHGKGTRTRSDGRYMTTEDDCPFCNGTGNTQMEIPLEVQAILGLLLRESGLKSEMRQRVGYHAYLQALNSGASRPAAAAIGKRAKYLTADLYGNAA